MNIESLHNKYCGVTREAFAFRFRDAHKRIVISRQQSLVDLIAVSSNLSINIFWEESPIDPLITKAINTTSPNFEIDTLYIYSDEQLLGVINTAKGKYFEYLVEEKLNAGEVVGDVALPDGYSAQVAENLNQPGWDLQILDEDGQVSDYLQLKAANSLSYISEALERYPDIQVLATSEVAESANGIVLNSNISEADLRSQVSRTLELEDTSFLDEFIGTFNPIFPLLFIVATEGYHLYVGEMSVAQVQESAKHRINRALVSSGVGALAYAMGAGWLSIGATFLGGALFEHYIDSNLASPNFYRSTERLCILREHQIKKLEGHKDN